MTREISGPERSKAGWYFVDREGDAIRESPEVASEMETDIAKSTLRFLVEKWFAPTPEAPVRVTRISPAGSNLTRCVRVEALHVPDSIAIFFFLHDDGTWCVFPPRSERPAMRAY
ncbi:hypothetical protein [Burkholderia sp. PU8-34]